MKRRRNENSQRNGLTERQKRNLAFGELLRRLLFSDTETEYREALAELNRSGWEIRKTPRDQDFAAAAEIVGGISA